MKNGLNMRITTLAVLAVATSLASMPAAEAKRGGSFFKSRGTGPVQKSGDIPAGDPRVAGGRSTGGFFILPLPGRAVAGERSASEYGTGGSQQHAVGQTRDIPTGSIAPADEVATAPARSQPRPWCDDGHVVGGGKGFCMVTLKPELRGAPAILSVTN